jgi:hypothetical protein
MEGFRNDLLRLGQVQEQVQGADKILSGQYLLSLPQAFQVVLIGMGKGGHTVRNLA